MRRNRNKQRHQDSEIGKNPIDLIDEVGKQIQNRVVGYQAGLRKSVAKLYGAITEIEQNFDLYVELIQIPCLADRKRIREATEENFEQYVHEAVVRRAFAGSNVSESCVSKYIGVVRHCTEQDVAPEKASAQIEEWGGLEAAYQRGKSPAKKDTSSSAKREIKPKAKTSGSEPVVTAQTEISSDDYLRITLPKNALRSLLKGKKGERRYIGIECNGRDEAGYLIWELFEDKSGYRSSSPDHDNDDGDIEDVG